MMFKEWIVVSIRTIKTIGIYLFSMFIIVMNM